MAGEKKSNVMAKVGIWAFTIGAILALIAGFLPNTWDGMVVSVLAVLGIIVGFLNVTDEETDKFLIAAVSIMIALYTAGYAINATISTLGTVGTYMLSILGNINIFVFPATIVVAIKALYALAKD